MPTKNASGKLLVGEEYKAGLCHICEKAERMWNELDTSGRPRFDVADE